MNKFVTSSLLVAIALAAPAWAQPKSETPVGPSSGAGAADMTDAEVRKVDVQAAKITLKHADIKSLDMPAMTMVFHVREKAMLDKVKPGDKVKFKAVNEAGKFTVTEIRLVQ